MLMAEAPLALCGLLTAALLVRWIDEIWGGNVEWGMGAALLFSAALASTIWMKPAGWSLALATPLAFWAGGQVRRLWSVRVWCAAGVVAVAIRN